MAVLHQYDYIFAVATVFAILDAWNIGANDVANSFATSVSSRSLTMKQAMAVATICEFTGSVAVGSQVAGTIRNKIVDPHLYDSQPAVLLLAMMCTIISSSLFLTFATRYGMPVSTTHSVVGGLVGTAAASVGIKHVNWGLQGVSQVFAAWIVAPGIAAVLGAAVFTFTKYVVLAKRDAVKRALITIPVYTFITVGAVSMLVAWKGTRSDVSTKVMLIVIFTCAGGIMALACLFLIPYLYVKIIREDWTLRWYHIFQGPLLLQRPAAPPVPPGFQKTRVKDYYRGHLTREELDYIRASEALLDSVQLAGDRPADLNKDDGNWALPEPAIASGSHSASASASGFTTFAGSATLSERGNLSEPGTRSSQDLGDGLIPPRPSGEWHRPAVLAWNINRVMLRGLEQDVVAMQSRNAVLKWDLQDMHARADHYDNRAEHCYASLQILTAAAASFTHGANDVGNAIAPFTTAYEVWSTSSVPDTSDIPIWILCLGGLSIVLGLLTYGYHVMRTLGNRLTLISPSRGFCMELSSALTVLLATRMSLPISTTQCITGATVGVGLANGDWRCINPKLVAYIYLGWIITVPVTAAIAGSLMALILNAPRWGITH